jgi:hypothetical protein
MLEGGLHVRSCEHQWSQCGGSSSNFDSNPAEYSKQGGKEPQADKEDDMKVTWWTTRWIHTRKPYRTF